ncbi:CLUMA_CG018756, isoform B [Clunio marinus]|nr:CLUMA_CG018756, isoform B [Clunio marinus]
MVNAEYDAQSVNSNAQSITSVNSLASLLKEKIQSLPAMIRKRKKPKDYKLRAFTAFLFLVIVFLVGYAYIMYNRKVTSRLYFDHIKFNGVDRLLHILDAKERNVLSGNLGVPLFDSKPFSCKDKPKDGSFCWEWTRQAKLYVNLDSKFTGVSSDEMPSTRCYTFRWESIDENFEPIDCFNIGEERGQWYGGGLTRDADWQLDRATFSFASFISGDIRFNQWSNAVRRYFINSHGVALEVDEATPLHISINEEYPSQFCLKAQHDNFAFINRPTPTTALKYRICTASDMKILHHNLTQKNLWDGLKELDINVIKTMFDEPVWEVTGRSLTDVSISNFTDSVIALGYFRLGHILINEQWQHFVGDYEMDEERFKALNDTINVLHRRGFRISLTIQPFVSTESKNFIELLNKRLLVYERSTAKTIPALTKFKNAPSVGVLDPTNNETIPWLLHKIDKTVKKYLVDSFYLEFGSAYDMPRFYECQSPLLNPDHYKTIFMNRISESMNLLGVSGAISVPRPPAFLNLPKVNSSWEGLQMVITSALNYGIIGYPFIMSGAVGGDYIDFANGTIQEMTSLPEKELYIRWLQLATFLPVLRFTHLPSDYKDERVTEIAKELSAIRQKTVTPILKKYLSDAMNEGLPLVRPLWMLDPHDVACLNVVDEFSVGEQLIVAPILERQKTIREVYLPQGVWKDGVDGSLRKGSRWIHNYRVPDDKIAYFVKMPDNTRF